MCTSDEYILANCFALHTYGTAYVPTVRARRQGDKAAWHSVVVTWLRRHQPQEGTIVRAIPPFRELLNTNRVYIQVSDQFLTNLDLLVLISYLPHLVACVGLGSVVTFKTHL